MKYISSEYLDKILYFYVQ